MAKSSNSINFRKVDVDKYDEDAYQDETDAKTASFNETEVNSAISGRNYSQAVKLICASGVIKNKDKKEKVPLVECFLRLSSSLKQADIEKVIKELDKDELNSLMKIVYMCFALKPDTDHTTTHIWFEKVFAEVGHGAIVRVLTDRHAVTLK